MKKYLILLVLILTMSEYTLAAIRYVTPNGAGLKNGTSWKNAYDSSQLQTAINEPDIKGVYVAAGTYKPTTGTDRNISFNLKSGIEIYGGFNGTETSYTQRNWIKNVTILSGDIGIPGDNSDNSYHVVYNVSVNSGAVLHGFTIQDGNADSVNYADGSGGGIFNSSSSPKISNCFITRNFSSMKGGGISNFESSSPTLINCIISENTALYGGGISIIEGSSPTFINCQIRNNKSTSGGGIYISGKGPNLINCLIANNYATDEGGGVYMDEALGAYGDSFLCLSNCTVVRNSANSGGGILNSNTMINVRNSIIWDNHAITKGNQICVYGNMNAMSLSYSCFSTGESDVYDYYGTFSADTYSINENPKFINPGSDFRITANSPCTDAGNNGYNSQLTDIRGQGYGRKLLQTDSAIAGTIDMGAYEYNTGFDPAELPFPTLSRIYVKWDALGVENGSSWDDAFTSLRPALRTATTGNEIWVAAGTYKPGFGSFNMKNSVAIYGGFAGNESLLNERNWDANTAVLLGEPYQDVIYNSNIDSTASLDGFTIQGGQVDHDKPESGGSGIHNSFSSPTITNCIITGNNSLWHYGAGINNGNHSSPKLVNCRISDNTDYGAGGGIANSNYSSPTLYNCIISNNHATRYGIGGGIYNYDFSSPKLINCTVSANTAMYGGGLYNEQSSSLSLKNSIIWGNGNGFGNQIYNSGGTVQLDYSCYANGTYDIITEEGTITASNCIITDPVFVNPTSDFRISGTSPCIDAGYNSYNTEAYDLRGQPRIQNLNIDMGAYEWSGGVDPLRFILPTGLPGEVTEAFKAFEVNGVITVVSGQSITGKARVTDMAGRTLAMENMVAGSSLRFNHHLVPGVYVVSVLTKNQIFSQKVIVR